MGCDSLEMLEVPALAEVRWRCFRGENAAESRAFFRNIKVAKVIGSPTVNKMSES